MATLRSIGCYFISGLFCLLVSASVCPAASKTPGQWSDAVQARYKNIDTLHAQFDQAIKHGESGIVEKRKGEIYFQKPLLVRWATKPPAEELLVVNKEFIWQYFPDEALATRYPLEMMDDKNAFLNVLFGKSSLTQSFDIAEAGREQGQIKLQLHPHEPTMSLLEAVIWLDPDDATITGVRILDFYGNQNEIRLNSIRLNAKIPSGSFAFSPPVGVDVEHYDPNKAIPE